MFRPVSIGNGIIIAQGSAATVELVRNGSVWGVQLSSLLIKDQPTTVTSNPGTVIGAAAESDMATAANRANAILGLIRRKSNTSSHAPVVAMGQQVILAPGITLSFVLNAIPVATEVSPAAAPITQPAAAATTTKQGSPAQTQSQRESPYICSAKYIDPHTSHTTFYHTDAFQASEKSLLTLMNAWDNYLKRTYHYSVDQYLASRCILLHSNEEAWTTQMEASARVHKEEIVHVNWKYVPGQDVRPPRPAASEPTKLYYCSGYLGATPDSLYFSDTFTAPQRININIVRDDFVRFIKEQYSPQSHEASGGCGYTDKAVEENNMRAKHKIIETGWKPKTLPPARTMTP